MRTYPALRVRPAVPNPEFADLVAAALDDFGVIALQESEEDDAVVAFFGDAGVRGRATAALRAALPGVDVASLDVPDENWAERSQAALRAIRAGALTVAPPWDVPRDHGSDTIVIVPSTGFGTGHHATTRLCLEALQTLSLDGTAVMDVGTGSGVLAIAASRLGAARVVAIDNDQDAVDNAADNAAANGVALDLRCASIEDAGVGAAGPFDIVTANLTGAALSRYAATLEALTRLGGTIILSGLREDEDAAVRDAFGRLEVIGRRAEDGWACLVMTRSQA
ncbi:MAG TPA: 50S ribosomal protein L11 methyltransferase [Vicinamibacterales bacterium]|nr:50S ribosomal protein L11 methyltransferase [Vicinamibacterales bacterium]